MSAWKHRLAATQEARKDPKWRERVGFDNIMDSEDLQNELPVVVTQEGPYPMEQKNGVESYEPSRAEFLDAKSAALARPIEKPEWTTPVLFLHASEVAPHEVDEVMDEAAYAMSLQHMDDLDGFEAAITKALCDKGLPMLFIQPGSPGHKEAKSNAMKMLVKDFEAGVPKRP